LQVRTGFVTEFVPGEPMRCRVLGASVAGEERLDLEGVEFEMSGTPCAICAERSTVFHPSGFLRSYPDKAELYAPLGTEAYMGLVYRDHDGRALGHVGIVHDQPLRDGLSPQALLHVFATRAAAELVRRRAEAERIAVERRLAEAQRAESVGLLAGGVAHDFNNLLVVVLGNASLGARAAAAVPELRGYFDEIELAASRAADLASQLLAYSGKGRFVVRSVDLNQVVVEAEALLRVTVPKNVELRIELDPNPLSIRGDVTQLHQVLMNLLMNAVESIGAAAGSVRLSTGVQVADRATLDSLAIGADLAPGNLAFVEVADTGCGMDRATRARIFEPFFTTKFTGRGLGLAAVQGIVRGHGGGLMISSELGRGTTMRLYLPRGTPSEASQSPPPRPPRPARPGRAKGLVLVAEDDAMVRTTAVRMLERLGFATLEAGDGEVALELLRTHQRELAAILLDATMPRRNGSEALRAITEMAPEIPLVLTSGFGERAAETRGIAPQRAGFLAKPFLLEDLRARLVDVLGRPS
jgi:signal transduction histidine kinase